MGVLIKGTIQVQDAESVVAQSVGVLAKNPNYIASQGYVNRLITAANEADLATAVQADINGMMVAIPELAFVSVNYSIQGGNHSAFILYVEVTQPWK